MQFSLKFMAGIVLFVALACIAGTNASRLWSQILFTITLLFLFSSILCSIYRRGSNRAFWLGASVFGWGYLFFAIALAPVGFEAELVTTRLLDKILPLVQKEVSAQDADIRAGTAVIRRRLPGARNATTLVLIPTETDFRILGHSLCVIFFAVLGGLVAKYLHFKVDARTSALLETVLECAGAEHSHKRQQAEMALEKLGDLGATSALQVILKTFSTSDEAHKTQLAARALELI